MAGTARTAGRLFAWTSATEREREGLAFDRRAPGGSAADLIDALVEAIQPVDGSQDAESARLSLSKSLADLLERFPEADLTNLNPEQSEFVIERYVARDVFARFSLDVGKTVHDRAASPKQALARLRDIRDYIFETIASSFRDIRTGRGRVDAGGVAQAASNALERTVTVFEEYL